MRARFSEAPLPMKKAACKSFAKPKPSGIATEGTAATRPPETKWPSGMQANPVPIAAVAPMVRGPTRSRGSTSRYDSRRCDEATQTGQFTSPGLSGFFHSNPHLSSLPIGQANFANNNMMSCHPPSEVSIPEDALLATARMLLCALQPPPGGAGISPYFLDTAPAPEVASSSSSAVAPPGTCGRRSSRKNSVTEVNLPPNIRKRPDGPPKRWTVKRQIELYIQMTTKGRSTQMTEQLHLVPDNVVCIESDDDEQKENTFGGQQQEALWRRDSNDDAQPHRNSIPRPPAKRRNWERDWRTRRRTRLEQSLLPSPPEEINHDKVPEPAEGRLELTLLQAQAHMHYMQELGQKLWEDTAKMRQAAEECFVDIPNSPLLRLEDDLNTLGTSEQGPQKATDQRRKIKDSAASTTSPSTPPEGRKRRCTAPAHVFVPERIPQRKRHFKVMRRYTVNPARGEPRYCDVPTLGAGIDVRESTILEAGRGVFVQRAFNKGDLVTEYVGRVISRDEARKLLRRGQFHYLSTLLSGMYEVDGIQTPTLGLGAASFINHARRPHSNVQWHYVDDKRACFRRLFARASRSIEAGEELFLDYGKTYWDRHRKWKEALNAGMECLSDESVTDESDSGATSVDETRDEGGEPLDPHEAIVAAAMAPAPPLCALGKTHSKDPNYSFDPGLNSSQWSGVSAHAGIFSPADIDARKGDYFLQPNEPPPSTTAPPSSNIASTSARTCTSRIQTHKPARRSSTSSAPE